MIPCPNCGGSLEVEDSDVGNEETLTCQTPNCGRTWAYDQLSFINRRGNYSARRSRRAFIIVFALAMVVGFLGALVSRWLL